MGFLPRKSLSISHLSKLSHIPTTHTQVPSPSSSPPPSSSHPPPRPPKDLMMGAESSGSSGSEEEEDEESAEDLERILLSLCSSSDEELEAPPPALGGVGDDWALDDGGDGFLELQDLADGELEEGVEEELGDGEMVDGDRVLNDFGILVSELMGVGDLLHTQVPSPSSSSHPPPSSSHPPPPPPPKDLMMDADSSGGSGSEEEESAEDLERILLSLCSSSDELEAPPPALGGVGDDWALGDGGYLELLDLVDGEFERGWRRSSSDMVGGDGVLDDFGVLESELMGVDDLLVGLEEVVRR